MSTTPTTSPAAASLMEQIAAARHVPRATYRVQLNADFTFADARAIIPYLRDLGISDLYASPILEARPGSTHGYDITSYQRLNPALGGEAEFDALVEALRAHGMGLVVDMVPNHMGVDAAANHWWRDVLENGPSSPYADFFDINWQPVKPELANKVLLPILEDAYGAVLESGKIRLDYDGPFAVVYGDKRLPVTPDAYPDILADAARALAAQRPREDPELQELQSILTALGYLPSYTATEPEKVAERAREKEIIKRRLGALLEGSVGVRRAVDDVLAAFNAGDAASFDRLDALLSRQPYRMAFWRVASDEINYRRFFDINDMAAIQIERREVFDAVHERVLALLAAGKIDALRIDHPDGLWHPTAYFRRLQESTLAARFGTGGDPAEGRRLLARWLDGQPPAEGARTWPLYVVAEKILSESEPLPDEWAVDGTTGYDFLNAVGGLFVDPAGEAPFTALYQHFIGRAVDYDDLIYRTKFLIMEEALASEIRSLSHELQRITEASRRYRDFTLSGLTNGVRAVIASLSVYRTYITGPDAVSERDQHFILEAVVKARRRNPGIPRLLLSFLRDTLLLTNLDQFGAGDRPKVIAWVMKFQQLSGPVMAKSVEDTAFYIYNRLVALNEVGGRPDQFGVSVEAFHAHNRFQVEHWPHTMLASSTHDTKRGEDVRARLSVLSEMPDEWEAAIGRWAARNADKKASVDDAPAPDANDEYLFYQTLLGIWPDGAERADDDLRARLTTYMLKAANEAKVHTSWINPDDGYTTALTDFVQRALDDPSFLADFLPLQRAVSTYGRINGLAQTVLKLTAPGVPDLYQGSELWNLTLVDPDNRRPVDFEQRRALLAALPDANRSADLLADLLDAPSDGRAKLYAIAAILRARAAHPDLFAHGGYEPIKVVGARADHVVAFLRRHGDEALLVVAPRLVRGLTGSEPRLPVGEAIWGDTALILPAAFKGTDLLSGASVSGQETEGETRLPVAAALAVWPVAAALAARG